MTDPLAEAADELVRYHDLAGRVSEEPPAFPTTAFWAVIDHARAGRDMTTRRVTVTRAQREAAKLLIERARELGENPRPSPPGHRQRRTRPGRGRDLAVLLPHPARGHQQRHRHQRLPRRPRMGRPRRLRPRSRHPVLPLVRTQPRPPHPAVRGVEGRRLRAGDRRTMDIREAVTWTS